MGSRIVPSRKAAQHTTIRGLPRIRIKVVAHRGRPGPLPRLLPVGRYTPGRGLRPGIVVGSRAGESSPLDPLLHPARSASRRRPRRRPIRRVVRTARPGVVAAGPDGDRINMIAPDGEPLDVLIVGAGTTGLA